MNPAAVVAYLALFGTVGFLFIFGALLLGRFLRASAPTPEKQEIYECGEPPVGSGYLQFDLRFYVVALVFIVFEVELALFFPWAVVLGKANQLAGAAAEGQEAGLSPAVVSRLDELGLRDAAEVPPGEGAERVSRQIQGGARKLALAAMVDLSAFFAVLLVGFAYVWHRGDLDWVRAIRRPVPPGGDGAAVQRGDG